MWRKCVDLGMYDLWVFGVCSIFSVFSEAFLRGGRFVVISTF